MKQIVSKKPVPTFNGVKYLTINTDASYYQEHKVGGYAFYIVCDTFRAKNSGEFKNSNIKSPQDAELMCIVNALSYLLTLKVPVVDVVVLNTDCRYGINEIKACKSELAVRINLLMATLKQITTHKHFKYKHVKAHSGIQDARSWVNEWCDAEAKRHARIKVNKVKMQHGKRI
jgi:ribonuclease HI